MPKPKTTNTVICEDCGAVVSRKGPDHKFCQACMDKRTHCTRCGKYRGKIYITGMCRACYQETRPTPKPLVNTTGYVVLFMPDHPRANSHTHRVLEHIVVWEQTHNQTLPPGWHIHHINGVKTDNRPDNLEAMPDKKHMRLLPNAAAHIHLLEQRIAALEEENKALRSQLKISP